jgi:hypothetical protein
VTSHSATLRQQSQSLGALQLGILLGAGGAMTWAAILIREWPRLMYAGQICGERDGLLGHCLLCAPAAAMTIGAVLALAAYSAAPKDRS